jgi:hypothetical protein
LTWKPGESGNPQGARIKARRFSTILERALTQEDLKPDEDHRIRQGIEKLLDKVSAGDLPSIAMLADRTDGKPAQQVTLAGDADNPLVAKIVREVVPPEK